MPRRTRLYRVARALIPISLASSRLTNLQFSHLELLGRNELKLALTSTYGRPAIEITKSTPCRFLYPISPLAVLHEEFDINPWKSDKASGLGVGSK